VRRQLYCIFLRGISHEQETPLILGRQTCGTWNDAVSYEWLVTNGLGGYACGTVAGANTRRYHAFLMASLAPHMARTLLVAKVDVSVDYLGRRAELGANEFGDGTITPDGFKHLQSFMVLDGIPTWIYAVADALLLLQIFMPIGANTAYLRLELLRASEPLRVDLRPFLACRDYHNQSHGSGGLQIEARPQECRVSGGALSYRVGMNRGEFQPEPKVYWNFRHREEAARGLDDVEDLYTPGVFSAALSPGSPVFLVASAESAPALAGELVLAALHARHQQLAAVLPPAAPAWIRELALAADQFIVQCGSANGTAKSSIVAGYPWFGDWGRDTMIALPGTATALKRYDIAAGVLRTYAGFVDGGMIPNRFPDGGEKPEYNTADATLWMFHALDDYLAARPDPRLQSELLPKLFDIIRAHQAGTRFGIRVDPADGLLHSGEPGTQLTWMDAKQGDTAFTPRVGKAVEINALWLNALDLTVRLAGKLGASSEQVFCQSLLSRAAHGFGRFWNAQRSCLFDVLDQDGGTQPDARIRPNQVLAVSLPYCTLSRAQMRAVVDTCARELLTSYGLRSLAPGEPGYIGRYAGGVWQRDSAYHMGTVWSWLLGPFARAHYRVYGDARLAISFLNPIAQHLNGACIGSVSEIFDGDAPHTARGCFAQAWGVAEILRSWLYLTRNVSLKE
jgi:predicted glycogen debranching enzyme